MPGGRRTSAAGSVNVTVLPETATPELCAVGVLVVLPSVTVTTFPA